jgi:MFS family permease
MIGGMVATPFYGWSAEKLGRKRTILFTAIPQIMSWTVIELSTSPLHLCIARFLVGFGGTGFYLVVPMYVVEIASNRIRGALGSLMVFSKTFGLVVGFTINSYMDFRTVPFIVITLLTLFFVGFLFAGDSPKHLMTQQRDEEAVAALKYFRGYSRTNDDFAKNKEFMEELAALKATSTSKTAEEGQKYSLKDFSE